MWPALRAWLARQLGYDEPGEGFDLSFTDQDVVRSLFSEDSGSLLTDSSRSCMREDHLLYNQELLSLPKSHSPHKKDHMRICLSIFYQWKETLYLEY